MNHFERCCLRAGHQGSHLYADLKGTTPIPGHDCEATKSALVTPKPPARAALPPEPIQIQSELVEVPPFSVWVDQECSYCGGTGADPGAVDPWNQGEPCPECGGSKTERVLRNYLGEAFRIVAGHSHMIPQREHLIAMTQYARQAVDALIRLPEVA